MFQTITVHKLFYQRNCDCMQWKSQQPISPDSGEIGWLKLPPIIHCSVKLLETIFLIQNHMVHQIQRRFTLKRRMQCRRSDTQPSSPLLNIVQDLVHWNSRAAPRFALRPHPRTPLHNDRWQPQLMSDWWEARCAGRCSGCGGSEGQR